VVKELGGSVNNAAHIFGLIFVSKTLMDQSPRDAGGGISLAGDWLSLGGDRDCMNGKLVPQTSSI